MSSQILNVTVKFSTFWDHTKYAFITYTQEILMITLKTYFTKKIKIGISQENGIFPKHTYMHMLFPKGIFFECPLFSYDDML